MVTPKPTPEPEPKPEPEPEPEPVVVDPMVWIQDNWRGRIRNVTITEAQKVPVYIGKEQVGEAEMPVGREVPLQFISEDTVTVHFLDRTHTVPITATDLKARATGALASAQRAAQVVTTPKNPSPEQVVVDDDFYWSRKKRRIS